MRFSELAVLVGKRAKKADTLVIIPFFTEYGILDSHLDFLSKQTDLGFDVIVILNPASEERRVSKLVESKGLPFQVLLAKRLEDSGSAGGYCCGQIYALENGYQDMVLADVDCYPVDKDLIAALHGKREGGYVRPVAHQVDAEGNVLSRYEEGNIPFYTLLSADVVKEYGTYFAPLYYGGDDVEYMQRIKQKPAIISNHCEHPFIVEKYYKNLDKYCLFLVNLLIVSDRLGQIAVYLLNLVFSGLAFFIFFPAYGKRLAKGMLGSFFTFTYGKKALDRIRSDKEEYIVPVENAAGYAIADFDTSFTTDGGYALMPFRIMGSFFRRKVLIKRTKSGFLNTITAMVSERAYFQLDDKRCILLSRNGNPALHALKLIVFLVLFPALMAAALAVYIPQRLLNSPRTGRYGVPKQIG